VKIAIIVEGKTETAFMPILRKFLESRLQQMPKLDTKPQNGRIPKEDALKRVVENLLGKDGYDAVIAVAVCPELKAFLNTILSLCGGELI